MVVAQVPIGWSSMNKGDAYILDIGEAFYVWNGDGCSRTERIKVSSMNKLRTNRRHLLECVHTAAATRSGRC